MEKDFPHLANIEEKNQTLTLNVASFVKRKRHVD